MSPTSCQLLYPASCLDSVLKISKMVNTVNCDVNKILRKGTYKTLLVKQKKQSQIYSENYRKKNFFPKNSTKMISMI